MPRHCTLKHACAVLELEAEQFNDIVRQALAEDIGTGDVTSMSLIPEDNQSSASIVAREPLIVAGLALAKSSFLHIDKNLTVNYKVAEGDALMPASTLMSVEGCTQSILSAERTALNFLQHLSGIATLTSEYVTAINHTNAILMDTRKSTPGWRRLEKHAVVCGGGTNHRMGLYDMVLIKDNHLAALRNFDNPISIAISRARKNNPKLKIEVEADTLEQAVLAAKSGADIVMLDNMKLKELREAVNLIKGQSLLEASGGISLDNIRAVADTGVDLISVGSLTHSARAADIALDLNQ